MFARYPWILYRYPWIFTGIRGWLADIRGYYSYVITGIYWYLAYIFVLSYYDILTTFNGQNSLKKWPSEINCSSEYINYRMFKTFLQLGNYLLRLSYQQRTVMRCRCRNVVVLASPVIYEYVHYVMNWVMNWVMNCYCRNPVYICTRRPMSLK